MHNRIASCPRFALALVLAACSDSPSGPAQLRIMACESGSAYAIGQTRQAELSASDCRDQAGIAFADYYQITLPAAGPVSITLQSTTISGPLIASLMRPNGMVVDADGTTAGGSTIVGGQLSAGTYVLIVQGQQPGRIGGYTLTSSATAPPPFDCTTVANYSIGANVNGMLTTADCADPGDYTIADYHRFTLAAPGPVSVTVRATGSAALVVRLYGASDNVVDAEYVGAGMSRIIGGSLPAGTYMVVVAAETPERLGSYSLSSAAALPPPFDCTSVNPHTLGTTVNGGLTAGDCPDPNGYTVADYYRFVLPAAGPASIEVEPLGAARVRLRLFSSDMNELDDDYAHAGGRAVVGGQLPAGTYYAAVAAADPGALGNYTLISSATAPPPFGCRTSGTLTIGTPITGSISGTDCLDPVDVANADYFEFTLAAPGPVSITVTPAGSVPMRIGISDAEEGFIDVRPSTREAPGSVGGYLAAGRYFVVVAAQESGATTDYTITSSATAPPLQPGDSPFAGCSTGQAYAIGTTITESLATADCVATTGSRLDRHDFTLTEARTITINLQSSAFDAYLFLFDANGVVIREDDDGGDGLNSRIVITLPPGSYSIGASSLSPGFGTYVLTTS